LFHVLIAFVTLNWMIKFVQHSLFQGVVELAAVGVSISTFNLVSRMFNMPLLNVTTSFVADDASKENRVNLSSDPASPTLPGDQKKEVGVVLDNQTRDTGKPMLASVSSALVLGTFLGVGEAGILAFLAGPMISLMGVSVVRLPAFVRSDSFSVAINV
jgi:hypothetical protein